MNLKGRPVSGGIGIGPAFLWHARPEPVAAGELASHEVDAELRRVGAAVAAARLELETLRAETAARLGEEPAAMLGAQLMMLEDPELIGRVLERIRSERQTAPRILREVGGEMAALLAAIDDPYLRERSADVQDVTDRLLRHLTGGGGPGAVPAGAVIVAEDLPPSELLGLPPGQVTGLALAAGGETSHTAILARSMGIPAVTGLGSAALSLTPGALLIVDGEEGVVAADRAPDSLTLYNLRLAHTQREQQELGQLVHLAPTTLDGCRVHLAANIDSSHEAVPARSAGAEGVGLYRTEFLFLERAQPPSEEEQYRAYREAVAAMAPHPVLIRTLDVGGDKPLPFLAIPAEENPFLGLRGIRLCQQHVDLFRAQLRAVLRAAEHGHVQVMVPMVSSRSEVLWVREQLKAAAAELGTDSQVELGIMVETPAAALMAGELAPLVDFFSIGTNDLTQYTVAVDRGNSRVAGLYDPLHPAVLRLIHLTVEGARRHGRWVGMCGELAGDPQATALLLGLGINKLSMSPPQLARVKRAVRSTDMAKARQLAELALAAQSADDVRALAAAL